jgi:molybdopterin synthase catalytic subunit
MVSRITDDPISLDLLLRETDGVDSGALVVFAGTVRTSDAGRDVVALEYDVHRDMAEAAIRRIEKDLLSREGILACRVVHRVGSVGAGEPSVCVVVRARHRPEGFAIAREAIDRVKSEVPIWKLDVFADNTRSPSPSAVPLVPGSPDGAGSAGGAGIETRG